MSKVIENPRSGCVLHGALQTVQEIKGAIPVVHANAGCGVINQLVDSKSTSVASGVSGVGIPGTVAQERHVIFGGASRLREQIKNTAKIINGELFVILNSCESAMVGDDVDAMTREIVEQGEPVVDTLGAGFNGNAYQGYENVLVDILKGIPGIKNVEEEKDTKLINIFGIVPYKDVYWQGNLEEIKRIFEAVGLKVNLFFGTFGGVQDLVDAYKASASIVFSRWGEAPAKFLNDKANIPVLNVDTLPVNVDEEEKLLRSVSQYAEVSEEDVDAFIEQERDYQNSFISQVVAARNKNDLSKRVVIIGDEEQSYRYAKILNDYFAAEVASIVIVDAKAKDELHERNNSDILNDLAEKVYYSQDKKEIEGIIKSSNAELILGSSLEKGLEEKLNIPLLEVSYPIYHSFILNRASVGTRGVLAFVENYESRIEKYEDAEKTSLISSFKSLKAEDKWIDISQRGIVSKDLSASRRKQLYN
ncbi:nitrogenase molybdenum-iron protein beta chain [Pseudobutyrivibrio sp. YE44]|uniref:nitrogenase component 1 n=1 Tax=Pseudobutyrivibrio sp. YE44 TaxID=1520802 RepID=UPI000880AFC2|nr:nitrogenase component 1 [Pseudobutyrivibrio sp. YE44]SDB14791.1 nitrogenase molybdenum-iron protein beta chain [Pseudobutyrivibrio sp. YE44]